MKQIKRHILAHLTCFGILLLVLTYFPSKGYAQPVSTDSVGRNPMDSVHISLLTCSPHQAVYSLYGHTALRVRDERDGRDIAVNYGMFNFDKPFFVLRFVFGLTDYEMGIVPFELFLREYDYYRSSVTEQEFNLTPDEKLRVLNALYENYLPENRVYRYNYFYDNCTTRARDIVVNNINGRVEYDTNVPEGVTFRQMIHEMCTDHPWAQLGNDLLLGVGSDRQLTMEQYQFLPHSMLSCADSAYITDGKGVRRTLVLNKKVVLEAGSQIVEKEFPLTPVQCAVAVLCLTVMLTLVEYKTKKYLWWFDAVLLFMQGACGLILTAMIFSQHPTVSLNIQILILSPLPLLFGYIGRHKHRFWMSGVLMICFALVLNALGVQWLDPAVQLLALCLLLRYTLRAVKLKASNDNSISKES